MQSDQTRSKPRSSMRRYAIFVLVITFVLCAAWTALWTYGRSIVAERVDQVLQANADGPATLLCADLGISGFPFRMSLSCSKAGITESRRNISATLAGVEVTALVYQPRHVIAELASPLQITWNDDASPLSANWSRGRSSVQLSGEDLARLSAEFDDLSVATALGALNAGQLEFHARPTEDGRQTDLALSADLATLAIQAETSAPFSLDSTFRVDAPPQVLMAGNSGDSGISVPDLNVLLTAGESRITTRGALTVSASGTVDGEVTIVTQDIPALAAFMQSLPSPVRGRLQAAVGGVIALSTPGTGETGQPVSTLVVTIRENVITAGNRQIGVIGPPS